MIQSVNKYPIYELFNADSKVVYTIPKYQREYTWSNRDWEALFDDILENERNYYLGSIICINQSTDAMSVQKLEVVDGQQRLTTVSLLIAAIYSFLKKNQEDLDDEQKVELVNLKRMLILRDPSNHLRLTPQIQNNNLADFKSVLQKLGLIEFADHLPYAHLRRINLAFRYFSTKLESLVEELGQPVAKILDFLEKLKSATLVKIEVDSHSNAFILFESLNNRGVPLSPVDLIKNNLLARLEEIEPHSTDSSYEEWNRVLADLGDDYNDHERFFRQFYNALRSDLKEISHAPLATRSNLIAIYDKLIKADPKLFLKKISTASKIYSKYISPNHNDVSLELDESLLKLQRIQGAPSYLLLLYLEFNKEELNLNNSQLKKVVDYLVNFFVRRNVTDIPPTRDLARIFMQIIDEVGDRKSDAVVGLICHHLLYKSASDEAFLEKLNGQIYKENADATRFILCAVAESTMTLETKVDLWKKHNKIYEWTIEHVLPQTENLNSDWLHMIAGGDKTKAIEIQQNYVHRLGNLTITGFNSNMNASSFEKKQNLKNKSGQPIGYNNGLVLNKDLFETKEWSAKQIEERTQTLIKQVMRLFSLD